MDPEKSLVTQFLKDGWLIPMIGAAGMLARLLVNDTKISALEQFKKIFSASISSGIAWFVLEQTDVPSLYKAIAYGVVGVVSPEVINGIVKLGKRFQAAPEKFIKK